MGFVIKLQRDGAPSSLYVGAIEREEEVRTYANLSDAAVYAFPSSEDAAVAILMLQRSTEHTTYSLVDVGIGLALPDDYAEEEHTLRSDDWEKFLRECGFEIAYE